MSYGDKCIAKKSETLSRFTCFFFFRTERSWHFRRVLGLLSLLEGARTRRDGVALFPVKR